MTTSPKPTKDDALKPCPFCGAGTTQIVENGKTWTGMKYSEPSSVSVRHWCEPIPGQPSRMLERVGKDHASAVAAWNTRPQPQADQPAEQREQPAASNPEPQAQAGEPLITIEPAIRGYQRFMDEDEETDPVERLRFFCSIAMNGQDWLDVEKFFDDVIAERAKKDAAQPAERVALTREQAEEARRVWLYGPVGHQSAFIAGIRYAEEAHGITAKDQS